MKQYDHMDNQKDQNQPVIEPRIETIPQPKSLSHSPFSKYLPLIVIAIVFVFLASAGTYLASKQSNTQPVSQNIVPNYPTPTPDPTANWKTYISKDNVFSFQYPENLLYTYIMDDVNGNIDENVPSFYRSQKDAEEASNCFKNKLGTMLKPCDFGLFDLSDVTSKKSAKDIQFYLKSNDSSLSKVKLYKDRQNREWAILGPSYGLGGIQTNAEVKINNKTYQLQIRIWDSFMNPVKDSNEEEQLLFIKQILSTFKFTP